VLWEAGVLRRTKAIYEPKWLNHNESGHWNATLSTPNPLAGKTYQELYGERGVEWADKISQGYQAWWNSPARLARRKELQTQDNPNFTTKGVEPHNKILNTFEFTCEFCDATGTRRNAATQRKRKTCRSKSCAQKWTQKYRRQISHPPAAQA